VAWFRRRAFFFEGHDHGSDVGIGGDDEEKLFVAAIAVRFEAPGVAALETHAMLAVGAGNGH